MKKLFRYLALGITVVLTAGSLSALAVREQVLKPEVYSRAITQAGVYGAVEDILIVKTAALIETTAKQLVAQLSNQVTPQREIGTRLEPLVVWYLNDLISKQTTPLVNQTAANLEIAGNLEAITDEGIGYVTGWFGGTRPDPKFFAYLPEPERLEEVKAQGVVPFVVQQIKQDTGIADLPPCADGGQTATNLKLVVSGKISEVNCYSPEIRAALEKAGQAAAPRVAQTQLAISLNAYLEKYQIKTLVNDVFNAVMDLSRFKQQLITLRADLALVQQQAQKALWGSLVFLMVGLGLTEKKRLKTLFLTYLWVGILMVLGAGGYTPVASRAVSQVMPETLIRITDPAISTVQNERLAKALETTVILVVKDWVTSVKFLGWSITILALLGLLITHLVSKNQEQKAAKRKIQPELFDEVTEAEATETTSGKKKPKTKKK